MKVTHADSTNFGARIRINKEAKAFYRDASIMSGLGMSATGSGIMSSMPAFDPGHHIHSAAKVVDGMSALFGVCLSGVGAACTKFAHTLFREGNKFSKLNK